MQEFRCIKISIVKIYILIAMVIIIAFVIFLYTQNN